MRICFIAAATAVQLAVAAHVNGQELMLAPPNVRVWDGAIHAGWFTGIGAPEVGDWNDWYDAPTASLEVGRYWTSHLKTEAGLAVAGEGRFYSQQQVTVPGQSAPVYRFTEHFLTSTQASGAVSYQLLENTWVHPFLTAGVLVAWEEERREIQDPFVGRVPVRRTETAERTAVRAFVGGGFKFYVNERAFLRTDAHLTLGSSRLSAFTWRAGAGIDF